MIASDIDDIDEVTLGKFIQVIHRLSGITLAANRKTMLQGRIRPRMRALNLKTFREYYDFLESHPEEHQPFVDQVTTNETYFFRTPRIWEYLVKDYLPDWWARNPGTVFNVWSAAASTGEEAHTLAMVCQGFKASHPGFNFQIEASDISQEVIDFAARGTYSGRPVELLKQRQPEVLNRYLREGAPGEFSFLPEVHSKIRFQRLNLFERTPFAGHFHLVLIRNVLIYFSPPDQEKVLTNVRGAMKDNAVLIIGESESLNRLATSFKFEQPLIYRASEKRSEKKTA